jgi:predicted nucleic acid-binding protein
VTIDPHPAKPALLFALALRHDLTAYDAVYLELGLCATVPFHVIMFKGVKMR